MEVFLLCSGIKTSPCLEKASKVIDGLIYNQKQGTVSIQPGIADADLFICDIELLNRGIEATELDNSKNDISRRINSGAILLCFAGQDRFNNYRWLQHILRGLKTQNLNAINITFYGDQSFISSLEKQSSNFRHTVIFNDRPPGSFKIGKNKSDDCVAIYMQRGKGHVFILPQHVDRESFIKYFVNEVIPKLNVDFSVDTGSREPMPEEINKLIVEGQIDIKGQIKRQKERVRKEKIKLLNLQKKYNKLEHWKDLLWQTGDPLENIVKSFFEVFGGIPLKKTEIDWVGEYDGKELVIEVKGREGCIDHKSDFRQIEERKNYNVRDSENTIALLVGNPFRLNSLDKRPPGPDQYCFAQTSIPIAKKNGIGLIWTKDLYDIVNDFLKNPKMDKKKVIDDIMNCAGVYCYKKVSEK